MRVMLLTWVTLGVILGATAGEAPTPPTAADVFQEGMNYKKLKDHSKAIELFNKAIKMDPDKHYFYIHRGSSKQAIKDDEGAIVDFTSALTLKSTFEGYYMRGISYSNVSSNVMAIQDLNAAFEIRPNEKNVSYRLGLLYDREKDFENAISYYTNYLRFDPTNYEVMLLRGKAYKALMKYDKAIDDMMQAIFMNTNFVKGYYEIYTLYLEQENLTEAAKYISMCIEYLGTHHPEYFIERAEIYVQLDLHKAACDDATKAEELGHSPIPGHLLAYCTE